MWCVFGPWCRILSGLAYGLLLDQVRARRATNLKRSGPIGGLATKLANCSTDVWPKLSTISTAAGSLPRNPMRTTCSTASRWRGVASTRPCRCGRARLSKSLSSDPPASSAAGVAPIACASLRLVAWFRSRS